MYIKETTSTQFATVTVSSCGKEFRLRQVSGRDQGKRLAWDERDSKIGSLDREVQTHVGMCGEGMYLYVFSLPLTDLSVISAVMNFIKPFCLCDLAILSSNPQLVNSLIWLTSPPLWLLSALQSGPHAWLPAVPWCSLSEWPFLQISLKLH